MKNPPRYIPEWPLPPYVFIPGVNAHPEKAGGYMHGKKLMSDSINQARPLSNQYFCYALDLFNQGFYWESHVYFEVLWNMHGRQGAIADFLKALIKLGAAGVKFKLEQNAAATGHLARALELFESVKHTHGEEILGFELEALINQVKSSTTRLLFEGIKIVGQ